MEKFGNQITVIKPAMFDTWNVLTQVVWETAMINAETSYFELLNKGLTPQEARGVLPHDLKTEITVKMNFRELDHFFDLRYRGITGAPHPDMKQVAELLYNEITEKTPFRGFEEDD
jgi:thymidylate synthase (FAD)